MISHLDERGYLTTPLEDIRQSFDQDVTLEQVEDALDQLQQLDPPPNSLVIHAIGMFWRFFHLCAGSACNLNEVGTGRGESGGSVRSTK